MSTNGTPLLGGRIGISGSTYGSPKMSINNTPLLFGRVAIPGGMGISNGMGAGIGFGLGGQAKVQDQSQTSTQLQYSSSPTDFQGNCFGFPKPAIGGSLFLSSDDHLTKQIEEKHAPDGRQLDVRPLLQVVQEILTNDTRTETGNEVNQEKDVMHQKQSLDSKILLSGLKNIPDWPLIIERLSCEMACQCLGGADSHCVTLSILSILTHFNWEAKLVLTLAAFAMSYGEFWLLSQIHSTIPLAKFMAMLKQIPSIMGHSVTSKPQFEAVNNLIKSMLDVTTMVVDFKKLLSECVSEDDPAVQAALSQVPLAVYWTIRSSVAAATHITLSTSAGYEYMRSANEMELSTWHNTLAGIYGRLRTHKLTVLNIIDLKKEVEDYNEIRRILNQNYCDNMTVLSTLFDGKDDIFLLHDGTKKERVQIDVLRGKIVLLLISSLDPTDEISVLEKIHKESETEAYKIVWVPVVDRTIAWNDSLQEKFKSLQSRMLWYSVHPNKIDGAVIRFFREDWSFKGKPILVGLDTQGKVTCPNAMPMTWIWGSKAFPFTNAREESLWKEESWKLDLLVSNIDKTVETWIKEDKYIFIFGGDDIDWIRRFTKEARSIAQALNISLELLYVGRTFETKKGGRKIISTIEKEGLSTVWKDNTKMWFFWTRLESMLHSKIQLNMANDTADNVAQEIKKLIGYDKYASGTWALLAKGPKIVLSGSGTTIHTTLQEFDTWKAEVQKVGFEAGLFNYHQQIYMSEHPCCRIEFPVRNGKIPDSMKCPECNNKMQKYSTFQCCHEGPTVTSPDPVKYGTSLPIHGASA